MNRQAVFRNLKDRGVSKVVVEFHGGNDEGFCEDIVLRDKDGKVIITLQEHGGGTVYNPKTKTYETPTRTGDEELADALAQPVYDEWGGFAFPGWVEGEVTWDVEKGSVSQSGQQSVEEFEGFEQEL